jgi:hypothetical protein
MNRVTYPWFSTIKSVNLTPITLKTQNQHCRSMIPPFHAAVDRAVSYLDQDKGLMGVCDFFTSGRYDLPLRQMSWARRFFWRSIFDTDNIDVGPERRSYLDHALSRVWEYNDSGRRSCLTFCRSIMAILDNHMAAAVDDEAYFLILSSLNVIMHSLFIPIIQGPFLTCHGCVHRTTSLCTAYPSSRLSSSRTRPRLRPCSLRPSSTLKAGKIQPWTSLIFALGPGTCVSPSLQAGAIPWSSAWPVPRPSTRWTAIQLKTRSLN